MAAGYSYNYFKPQIKEWFMNNYPKDATVLDIGAGGGTYYDLLGDYFTTMDACEAFEKTIEECDLKNKYRTVYAEDIRNLVDKIDFYDIIIMGDVLEHLEVKDAQKVIKTLLPKCNQMLVAVPYKLPQDEIDGNKYEKHLQPDLTPEIFAERYPQLKLMVRNHSYGYYLKDAINVPENLSCPKLSIIISCRNEEKYIKKLLDSLSEQTWTMNCKREVLFTIDQSTDNTETIISEWIDNNNKYECKVFHTDCGSLSTARNVALDNATGEYIWFMDARDWLECDNALDTVFDCMHSCARNVLEFKNAVNCDKLPHNTDSHVWGAIYSKDIIGDTRFLGSDALFVKTIYEKPEMDRGGLAIIAYHHNEDGRW